MVVHNATRKYLHDLNSIRTSKYLKFMFIDGGLQIPDTGDNDIFVYYRISSSN